MLKKFCGFALEGNVTGLAYDIISGARLSAGVSSLVDGVLKPVNGRVLGRANFAELFRVQSNPNIVPVTSPAIAERRAWRHSISVCSPMQL